MAFPSFFGVGVGLWGVATFTPPKDLMALRRFAYLAVPLSYIFCFVALHFVEVYLDQDLLRLGAAQGARGVEVVLHQALGGKAAWSVAMVVPSFLFYGIVLATHFLEEPKQWDSYRLELVGILGGAALCVVLLEGASWPATVFFIVGSALVAAGMASRHRVRIVLALVFLGFAVGFPFWQIDRDLNLVVRDFARKFVVHELRTRWTSFAKVQLLEVVGGDSVHREIAVGDGAGLASVPGFTELDELPTVRLVAAGKPGRVLVLFAGAGAELIGLRQMLGPQAKLWGTEINSAVMNVAKAAIEDQRLSFLHLDNRRFLETSALHFDSILYSWSGATVANFSGAILHTTEYSFTLEALRQALRHLNPDGKLIVMGGNKLNLLTELKQLEREGVAVDAAARVVLFDERPKTSWRAPWDNFILIYKNGAYGPGEIDELEAAAGKDYRVMVRDEEPRRPRFKPYLELLQAPDSEKVAHDLWIKEGILPQSASDDRPFAYRNTPSVLSLNLKSVPPPLTRLSVLFLGLLMVSWRKRQIGSSADWLRFFAWAPLSSICFLYFLYKGILFLGQPSWAFLVVQTALQIGALLGLNFSPTRPKPRLALFAAALILLVAMAQALRQSEAPHFIFQWSLPVQLAGFFLFLGGLSFAFSSYFLGGLKESVARNPKSFAVLWALETLLCGLTSLSGAYLVEEGGLTFAIEFSVGLSLTLLLLASLSRLRLSFAV